MATNDQIKDAIVLFADLNDKFESVYKNDRIRYEEFSEPWSHHWVYPNDSKNNLSIVLLGIPDNAFIVTEGELKLFEKLSPEVREEIIKHWIETRRTWNDFPKGSKFKVPFQDYTGDRW